MIEEINKIGEIQSVGDFFDFKLSIKTIILVLFAWAIFITLFIIFMLGGINNTIDYINNIINATKQNKLSRNKQKNTIM